MILSFLAFSTPKIKGKVFKEDGASKSTSLISKGMVMAKTKSTREKKNPNKVRLEKPLQKADLLISKISHFFLSKERNTRRLQDPKG